MNSRVLMLAGLLLAAAPLYGQQSPGPPKPPAIVRTVYDMDKVVARPSLSDDQVNGKKLFTQRCALCHDALGQPNARAFGPWLDVETVKRRGEAGIKELISVGVRKMPGWQHTLEPAQIGYIVEYLKIVTPDQRPKPVQSKSAQADDDPQ
jgi:mono/diheme cytochrome c family protein